MTEDEGRLQFFPAPRQRITLAFGRFLVEQIP
jgi:hypothetical protein